MFLNLDKLYYAPRMLSGRNFNFRKYFGGSIVYLAENSWKSVSIRRDMLYFLYYIIFTLYYHIYYILSYYITFASYCIITILSFFVDLKFLFSQHRLNIIYEKLQISLNLKQLPGPKKVTFKGLIAIAEASNYMFKDRKIRSRLMRQILCWICSKLTIIIPKRLLLTSLWRLHPWNLLFS